MGRIVELIEAVKAGNLGSVKSILDADSLLINQRNESGATPLHYAAFAGHQEMVKLLIERGADPNSTDGKFGATPAGWAIEYIRELGGYLATDLEDLSYAIHQGDARWVRRFLERFPNLRRANDIQGKPFSQLAKESGNHEIKELYSSDGSR